MLRKTKNILIFLLFLGTFANAQNCDLSYSNQVKYLKLNDSLSIAYVETGNKNKQTILMIHGLGGSLANWENNYTELAKNHHCIAIDLPNYGLSSKVNLEQKKDLLTYFSETILAIIKAKKLKNIALMGHSMGGQIAMITALDNPKICKKLILVAPAGLETFTESEAKMLINFSTPQFFRNQDESKIRAAFQSNFYKMPESAEHMIQDRLKMKNCAGFGNYFSTISMGVNGMLAHPVRNELKNIKQKTFVIVGENDALIPNKILHKSLTISQIASIASNEIRHSELLMIPQAGHLVMCEQAPIFNESINKFLK